MKTKKKIVCMAKALRRATNSDFITCKKVVKGWLSGLTVNIKDIEGVKIILHDEDDDDMLWWSEVVFRGIHLDGEFFFVEMAKDFYRHMVALPLPERRRYFNNHASIFCGAGYRPYNFNNGVCVEHGLETPDRKDYAVVWNEY